MNSLPSIRNYGRYSSDNYGAHTLAVHTPGITLYYSYETIVAYSDDQDGLVCSQNFWTTTTGKHLNWIQPDKSRRVKHDVFCEMRDKAVERHFN